MGLKPYGKFKYMTTRKLALSIMKSMKCPMDSCKIDKYIKNLILLVSMIQWNPY